MVTPTYPGVYIQELTSPVHPITGAATSIGAFVGYTARGIDQRAQEIFSFSDYQRLFGGLASNSELSYAVQQFFANGGNQAYVVRVPRTGAAAAAVTFDSLTFTALSSGSWANGQLLIDVDYNNIAQPLAGPVTVTSGSTNVTGTGFQTTLQVNQWLIFALDPTQTPYQISQINSNTSLTLAAPYVPAATNLSTAAFVIVDPTAFNLTVTDLVDGTTEPFPNLSLNNSQNNYLANVVNDPDNGSQLVNVVVGAFEPNVAPPMTGIVGVPLTIASVDILLGGTELPGLSLTLTNGSATVKAASGSFTTAAVAVAGNVTVTPGSNSVQGSSPGQFSALATGQSVTFAADTTNTLYQIGTITSTAGPGDDSLTLTQNYVQAGAGPSSTQMTPVTTALVGSYLVFASDPTSTPYLVSSVPATGSLTLSGPYAGASTASGSATTATASTTSTSPANLSGNVTVTSGSRLVQGSTSGQFSGLTAGQSVVFSTDSTKTLYQVATVTKGVSPAGDTLTLTQNYVGATSAAAQIGEVSTTVLGNYYIQLTTVSPTTAPLPLPIIVSVFASKTPIPQTVSGLASQLQKTINSSLSHLLPGAYVVCSVSGVGAGQAIRVNAMLPQFPDAVITITPPPAASGLLDASAALGFGAATSLNVAHYALGTNNGTVNNQILAEVAAVNKGSEAVSGTGGLFTSAMQGQWIVFSLDPTETPYQIGTFTDANDVILTSNYAGPANVAASSIILLSWIGQQSSSTPGLDGTGLPGTADLIGNPGSPSGIYALQNVDQFNLLCIPDATRAVPGNPAVLDYTVDPNAIYSAAVALCDTKRAMLLLDCPPYVNTIAAAVDWKTSGLTVSDPNGAAFFPRLRLPDPLNNYNLRTFAPCGVVAGLYAQTDASRGVWKAPAGTAATLAGVQGLVYKMSDAENGALNPLGLNCFRTFPVYGSVLWGARTLVGADVEDNQWKYVPVRRVALYIESSLYQGTQWVVFEPNDEPLWSAIRLNVGTFMQNLFTQGYFQGQTPSDAYFVKCDNETTTQADINLGIVNIVVGFAPLEPAEFVIIQIQQMAGQNAN